MPSRSSSAAMRWRAANPRPMSSSRRRDASGVDASDCLVFEDAPMGIEAAQAAGMPVVALTTSFQASHFEALQAPPTLICGDFEDYLR